MKKPSRLRIPDQHIEFWTSLYPNAINPSSMRALFALRSLAKQINDAASDWLAPFGLTSAKYNYLVVLYVEQRPLTFNEIKEGIHTTPASVTGMIKSLEQDNLVKRSENPDDARSTYVSLTSKGRKLVERVFPLHHSYIDEAMRDVPQDQVDELFSTLLAVGAGFEATAERRSKI